MIYETPVLETDRLILKRGNLSDFQKVYEYDFRKLRNISGEFEYVKQDPKNLEGWEIPSPETYDWIMYLKNSMEPIGNVIADRGDKNDNSIELAFNTHPDYWRKGYTMEAIIEIMKYLFNNGYDRILCGYDEGNYKSKAIGEKLGFELCEVKENAWVKNGVPITSYTSMITKEKFMKQLELQEFNKRIGLNTDLSDISKIICERYNLGEFISNKVIMVGYEDYNYCLETSCGKYCVKIFSKVRDKKEINDYLDRIRRILNSNVSAPKPFLTDNDILLSFDYKDNHYDLCVFEYINGKDFFEIGNVSRDVICEIAKQTAMIHELDVKLNPMPDSWSVINFEEQYNLKKDNLPDEYKVSFDKLIKEFKNVDFKRLPYAFVHGDIRSANTMLDINNRVWIVDFAVSNYLPRIIDLAVTSCDMCLDRSSSEKTLENITLLLEEYNKYHQLTNYELEVFRIFYRLVNAMYILQTHFYINEYGDSEENQDLLSRGTFGYKLSEDERLINALNIK